MTIKQSIEQKPVIELHEELMKVRAFLQSIFGEQCSVRIGGSYALKYWSEFFKDREIHDYDFIVCGNLMHARKTMKHFVDMGVAIPTFYYNEDSFMMGKIGDKPINIIISNIMSDGEVGSLFSVYCAKMDYIKAYRHKGLKPRDKDIRDCYYILKDINTYKDVSFRRGTLKDILYLAKVAGVEHEPVEETFPILAQLA